MKNLLKIIRPHQYVKNFFIFMPLFFAGKITNIALLSDSILAFIAFSFSASAIYIFNDYKDIDDDRLHPKKKHRPLASGAVSKRNALSLMFILFFFGFVLMVSLSLQALAILFLYVVLNTAYSLYLKHVAIIDVTIIAIGFVLRLFVGAAVTNTTLSMWIVITTFLLAMFLALAKRRDDVLIFLDTGKKMRKVVDGYSLQLIDSAMLMMASVVIVAYILYTTSVSVVQRMHSEYLYLTALFVILGILRYLQITLVEKNSGSPTRVVLSDSSMQVILVAWILSFVWLIYL